VRRAFAGIVAAALLSAGAHAETPEWAERAGDAAGRLGKQLKSELVSAMQSSGPTGAVRVCNERAPEIASELSGDALRVGRTALRVRNPANAPDAFERDVLERFAARIEKGADPASLVHREVRETDGRRIGRWMKAIPMQPECTACHGTAVAESLAATIDRLYPEDRATGFEIGELRGAFTVTVELPAEDAAGPADAAGR
jgi:hypothetical protein